MCLGVGSVFIFFFFFFFFFLYVFFLGGGGGGGGYQRYISFLMNCHKANVFNKNHTEVMLHVHKKNKHS